MPSKSAKNPSLTLSSDLMARLQAALEEDVRGGDVTSQATISDKARGRAVMRAKASGIICGLTVARAIFRMACPTAQVRLLKEDGARIEPGDWVMEVAGPMRGILTSERVALNFVQRMSGVATLTARYAQAAQGARAGIYDTRKTNPLWRDLDRYAVRCGGGRNHRYCLDDMILIKNNHADACGSVGEAVKRAREWRGHNAAPGQAITPSRRRLKIMAETRSLVEVRQALAAGADYIMLDNMTTPQIRRAVALIAGQVPVEVSGGVDVKRARVLAQLGVDRISVGALTHSAPALDVSLAYLE